MYGISQTGMGPDILTEHAKAIFENPKALIIIAANVFQNT
jgi:hypothetical protein